MIIFHACLTRSHNANIFRGIQDYAVQFEQAILHELDGVRRSTRPYLPDCRVGRVHTRGFFSNDTTHPGMGMTGC